METMVKIDEIITDLMVDPSVFGGHFACEGCSMPLALKLGLSAVERPIVVIPASCASVVQSLHPNVSFNAPVLNIAFASHAAAATGIARAKKMRGEKATVLVWSGDGGSFDIGVSTLSGAAERGENIIHAVYDNGFYGNTGAQRSGATPRGADTTTTPNGKQEKRKSLARIIAMHDVAYVATTSVGYPRDVFTKFKKASMIEGFKFILIDAPCPTGWVTDPEMTVELGRLAVQTGYFPLWEYQNGKLTFTRPSDRLKDPSKRTPLEEYLKPQGRFKNMTPDMIKVLEQDIQYEWDMLARFE